MELKIAGTTRLPFVRIIWKEINGKNVSIVDEESWLGNIISTLSQQFHYNYTLIYASTWGTKNQSAKELKFNGMVGMLQNDEVDLALGPFVIERGDRYLVADPSAILMEDAKTILSSGQKVVFKKSSYGVSLLTKSLETNVWYWILMTLLVVILLSSFVHYNWSKKSYETSHVNEKSFIKILIKNSFEYFGNLIRQCDLSNSHGLPEILKYCWKISSSLLIFFYSSMILVHLIACNKKRIDTFVDLSNSQAITTTSLGSIGELIIRNGKTDELRRIYINMIKNGLHNYLIPIDRLSSDEIMDEILSGKRALIESLSLFKSLLSKRRKKNGRCGFYISESNANYEPRFMLYNKKFDKKLKEKIDFRLLEIFERKPFDLKLEKYYLGYKDCLAKETKSQWKPLILFNIRGLLLVCVIIITLALIALFLEIICNLICNLETRFNRKVIFMSFL